MTQKTSSEPLSDVVASFVKQLLAADYNAAEISFTLSQEAIVLGLHAAPNPELAIVVVMDGGKSGCASKLAADEDQSSENQQPDTAPTAATVH
ncbi:hypothetical protein [Aurantiacibacter poecillastricola]|uniref:hypothetical protein n=1 Tax=Aurantiacibacter poecillastricola TaxID=3064385 RepID=UPI00273D6617|nr:hypothetical protein [Aurantiacibacter sp. 219JJ12-13]MDP5263304.1 hypothetical protein [Aurantiacibacter sp. 219JJ12-13]